MNLIALRHAVKNGNPTFSGKAMSELLAEYDFQLAKIAELESALKQARGVIEVAAEEPFNVSDWALAINRRAAEWMKEHKR